MMASTYSSAWMMPQPYNPVVEKSFAPQADIAALKLQLVADQWPETSWLMASVYPGVKKENIEVGPWEADGWRTIQFKIVLPVFGALKVATKYQVVSDDGSVTISANTAWPMGVEHQVVYRIQVDKTKQQTRFCVGMNYNWSGSRPYAATLIEKPFGAQVKAVGERMVALLEQETSKCEQFALYAM